MKVLITGGAGFIGCNMAKRLMKRGDEVIIFDNLSRKGSQADLEWLRQNGPLTFINGDVRDYDLLRKVFEDHRDVDVVMHFAAQVAVTTSVVDPREDVKINALGTFNVWWVREGVVEERRRRGDDPIDP